MNKDWMLTVLQEVFSHYCHDYCIKPLSETGDTPDCANCTEKKVMDDIARIIYEYKDEEDESDTQEH